MRLALTAGGTAGHIFPALAVLDAVCERATVPPEVRFFGPEDRGERVPVEARGIRFESVPSGAIRGRTPVQLAKNIARLAVGTLSATRKLRAFNPDAVFSTGGYGSFPCSVAARLLRRPLVVYLPDVSPGWAVKAETRLATRMATTTEAALRYLPKRKTTITGYPVRGVFFTRTREQARAALGIGPDEKVLVIAGATQGAHALNAEVFVNLKTLLETATVFHITGHADLSEAVDHRDRLDAELAGRYHMGAFREDLPTVMLAADLAVMRAGASTLGELPAAALPALLVPAGYAGGHQRENAQWLVDAGAAEILDEHDLGTLPERVKRLLDDKERLAVMRTAAASLARPNAADAIARIIEEVAAR